jgi:hypothetical protein
MSFNGEIKGRAIAEIGMDGKNCCMDGLPL